MHSTELLKNARVTPDLRGEINWRAYMHFVNEGGGHGNDLAHWLQAEREVLIEHTMNSLPPGSVGESGKRTPRKSRS